MCEVYILFTLGAPIPSPQLGTFTFPPITPTALIAPITLPGKEDVYNNVLWEKVWQYPTSI